MKNHTFLRTIITLTAVVTLQLSGNAQTVQSSSTRPHHAVEMVFVLDTTGSMSGLIQAAKEKIWAIVNTVAQAKPTPEIRLGLVGYRDRGDTYVTKYTDLTSDIDAVYSSLMSYEAEGGGDTPESVNQGLYEAVTQLSWSRDPHTYRVIFLIGDCPPHMDYANDIKYPEICKKAASMGININTIQCGHVPDTTIVWKDIASRADGKYFQVEQSGSAIIADTPFDAELARLSRELEETRVYFGTQEERDAMEQRSKRIKKETATMPAPMKQKVLASRAVFNTLAAGKKNFLGEKELVAAFKGKSVDLETLPREQLPPVLRDKNPEERKKWIEQQAEKREKLQQKIRLLGEKRQAFLRQAADNLRKKHLNSLDDSIFECIRDQAKKKGLIFDADGPQL